MMDRPKYRYITQTNVRPDSRLSDFRLYPGCSLDTHAICYLRVTVPDSVTLIREKGRLWDKAMTPVLIQDADPVAVIRILGRASHMKGLWPRSITEWKAILMERGYVLRKRVGFVKY